MTINVGDKELVFYESIGTVEVVEITYSEINGSGAHKAISSDKTEFTRCPPDGTSMSGYVVFRAGNKSYQALSRKKGLSKEPGWLREYSYYAFCNEHKTFYRTDCRLGCFNCHRSAQQKGADTIATSWE